MDNFNQNNWNNQNYNNPYTDPNANNQYYPGVDPELEKKAGTIKTLGIVSLIVGIIGMCCCTIASPIIGIVGLVKAGNLEQSMNMLSPQAQNQIRTGKILCIVGIVLGVLGFIINLIINSSGIYDSYMQGFMEGMQNAS